MVYSRNSAAQILRSGLIGGLLLASLSACQTPQVVVKEPPPTPIIPPPSASAALEVEPTEPPLNKELVFRAIAAAVGEQAALNWLRWQQAEYPDWARRGWARLAQVQEWFRAHPTTAGPPQPD